MHDLVSRAIGQEIHHKNDAARIRSGSMYLSQRVSPVDTLSSVNHSTMQAIQVSEHDVGLFGCVHVQNFELEHRYKLLRLGLGVILE